MRKRSRERPDVLWMEGLPFNPPKATADTGQGGAVNRLNLLHFHLHLIDRKLLASSVQKEKKNYILE